MNRHEVRLAKSRRRTYTRGAVGLVALGALGLIAPACLDRPVAPQQPSTSKLSTQLYKNQKVDKIDLLIMIDNSASMADKQKILAAAVPDLVGRLTNPVCVDRETRAQTGQPPSGTPCADGSEREFEPVVDIHIGVITSSIGGHGADSCSNIPTQNWNPRQEDMAHLVTRGKPTDPVTWNNKGFLNWDPTGKKSSPPGESNADTLSENFTLMVRGADQDGCGFEASLEAWYRFLVDPAPYARMVPVPCFDGDTGNQCRGPQDVDNVVLQQRADFLRQDSLLAVIMLSDENDCSVMDWGQNFLSLQALDGTGSFHLARGTDACLTDPWDANCKSCWEVKPDDFPECAAGWAAPEKDDTLNLRCFNQKRRFGIDFLQPIRRYVDGLSEAKFADGTINPVFCTAFETKPNPDDPASTIIDRTKCTKVLRDGSLVFLAGIVGVPWQDIARDPMDLKKGYRTAEELRMTGATFDAASAPPGLPADKTLWNMILGEVDEQKTREDGTPNPRWGAVKPTVDPLDPLMIESIDPRSGTHPATGTALVQPGSGDPVGNPVNSSEWNIPLRSDLQYACTFPLTGTFGPLDCSLQENAFGCDCNASPENPLCWNGTGYGTMQHRAKAYPGRRQLAVLKGMAEQAIVASVCPANMSDVNAKDFGYRPAIGAIVDRLKGALQGTCWDQELAPDDTGAVECVVLEAIKGDTDPEGNVTCQPCVGARTEPTDQAKSALASDKVFVENGLNCVCEISQAASGPALDACIRNEIVTDVEGWCYVDPNYNGNTTIVANCPVGQKRLIRFVGNNIPAAGSLTFLQCRGATIGGATTGGGAAGAGN